MSIEIRPFKREDVPGMVSVWNEVVNAGNAFPQEEPLTLQNGEAFFSSQTVCAVAVEKGVVMGLYILHPNNVGRCGHICNASYAVASYARGRGIGESLVKHCMKSAGEKGYRVLQFNAVVVSNKAAIALYDKLGFTRLGTVKGGFKNKDGIYEDIMLFYHLV